MLGEPLLRDIGHDDNTEKCYEHAHNHGELGVRNVAAIAYLLTNSDEKDDCSDNRDDAYHSQEKTDIGYENAVVGIGKPRTKQVTQLSEDDA